MSDIEQQNLIQKNPFDTVELHKIGCNLTYNSWTYDGIKKVKEWIHEANYLADCHNYCGIHFNLLYRTIGTLNIITASISSALSFFNTSTNTKCESSNNKTDIISTSIQTTFSTLTVVLSSVNSFFNWQIKKEFYIIMSNEYRDISRRLEQQTLLQPDKREEMSLLLEEFNAKFTELASRAPIIPEWIQKKIKLRNHLSKIEQTT